MTNLLRSSVIGIGLALLAPTTFAVDLEEAQSFINQLWVYGFFAVAILAALCVSCAQLHDKKRTVPLKTVLNGSDVLFSVAPDTLVTECVRKMTDEKIGGLVVMNGDKLIGIFTERDALNRVLAAGRDPREITVSEVMTRDPYCVSPQMSVADAMELVTERRFRHLPIVEDGHVRGILSSGDLTKWLAKDQLSDVQDLVKLAMRS